MNINIAALVVLVILVGGAVAYTRGGAQSVSQADTNTPESNVSIVDGKQIIEIRAKGGYLPSKSVAKAGIPTILRFDTSGTFDCSSSVRIPSMNISQILPQTGTTDIAIGVQPAGIFNGTCGMGMYPFEVDFQ